VRRLLTTLGIACVAILTSAHVGTNTAIFDGEAGPYSIRVVIRPPNVIPGIAEISVRVRGDGVDRVTVQPFQWNAGLQGAPPPDTAVAVPGDGELYSAELWLMTRSSYNVQVQVAGSRGEGTAMVPLNAVATETLEMSTGYGLVLAGMGLFLFFGAVTIVGAAVRESVLPPGEEPGEGSRIRSWIVMGVSAVVLGGLIFFGGRWWDSVEAQTRNLLYRPLLVESSVAFVGDPFVGDGEQRGNDRVGASPGGTEPPAIGAGEPGTDSRAATDGATGSAPHRVLTLDIVDEDWRNGRWTPLVADHGKLMHMWLVSEDFGSIAHLHPVRRDSERFDVAVPEALPGGTYRIYADITHESGFAQTLVDTVAIMERDENGAAPGTTEDPSRPAPDPDDSWLVDAPGSVGSAQRSTVRLADGSSLTWVDAGPVPASVDTTLVFRVTDPDGDAPGLEPYMGMTSHAAVSRPDGSVFAHLHPVGTISMAARQTFERRSGSEPVRESVGVRSSDAAGKENPDRVGRISFPFAFPESGEYRIWVQVKRDGRVLTGSFEARAR